MGQAAELSLQENDLALTPAAYEKMAELIGQAEDDDLQAIRVFVSGGGCGGMGYGMTFTDTRTEYDYMRKEKDFAIYVDAVALNYLRGVEIDYVDRPTGASFVCNNAVAMTGGSGTCGACGAAGGGCACVGRHAGGAATPPADHPAQQLSHGRLPGGRAATRY